jgi:DNA-binding transcriptional regulator YiaG
MKKYHSLIFCKQCNKKMEVRNDYIKKHTGICMSCQKKGNKQAVKHGDYKERLYKIWQGLFHRRYRINPTVCNEWHEYENFKKWSIENGYKNSLTIDRIKNTGNYEPSNCQWISLIENSKKDKIIFTDNEKLFHYKKRKEIGMTQTQYAKSLGVSRNTIQRLEKLLKEKTNEHE